MIKNKNKVQFVSSPFLEVAEKIDKYRRTERRLQHDMFVCHLLNPSHEQWGCEYELCLFFCALFDLWGDKENAFMSYDENERVRSCSENNEHRVWALLLAHELWLEQGYQD